MVLHQDSGDTYICRGCLPGVPPPDGQQTSTPLKRLTSAQGRERERRLLRDGIGDVRHVRIP